MGAEREELERQGKAARENLHRRALAALPPRSGRDVLRELQQGEQGRIPELVVRRREALKADPFAFFRATAALMAADLAVRPSTGLVTQLSGDAHLRNFGWFGAADGTLRFDLNDFDETAPGPFEWDLCRLVASIGVCGRQLGVGAARREAAVHAAVEAYRDAVRDSAEQAPLARWATPTPQPVSASLLADAAKKSPEAQLRALTEGDADARRFELDGEELLSVDVALRSAATAALPAYARSLHEPHTRLLELYRVEDVAFRVGGLGSLGLHALLVLLHAPTTGARCLLQLKEERVSCVEAHWPAPAHAHHGERVVVGQKRLQCAFDPLLGAARFAGRDWLVRRFPTHKFAPNDDALRGDGLADFAAATGTALGRAHARAGEPISLASYLGSSDQLQQALTTFAERYAEQVEADWETVRRAL